LETGYQRKSIAQPRIPENIMRTIILGSGNVATTLGERICVAGHEVQQVFSRTEAAANKLARLVGAQPVTRREHIKPGADLYLIAVADAAIADICGWLRVTGVVVHTAGSVAMDVLRSCSSNYGVLYPLQSLRKETAVSAEIPILVDGCDSETIETLFTFARGISGTVQAANDEKRGKLHIAAVVTNNFCNHLFTMASDYCKKENLDFRLLLPLITETSERLKFRPPAQLQTGPAARNDMATIRNHLEQLKSYPDLAEIYRIFTAKILDYHHDSD
jgi:predicted short-subunit dehydrogenase-like oxidoreductase (DUF2520 family)